MLSTTNVIATDKTEPKKKNPRETKIEIREKIMHLKGTLRDDIHW